MKWRLQSTYLINKIEYNHLDIDRILGFLKVEEKKQENNMEIISN